MPDSTIATLFREQVKLGAHRPALREKRGGRWVTTTWADWWSTSRAIAASLLERGLAPGDRVAIFARTRQAWVEADMGVLLAGGVTVPIYPTVTGEQAAFFLRDSGARFLFVDDPGELRRIRVSDDGATLGELTEVVVFDTRVVRSEPDEEGRRVWELADAAAACPTTVTSFAEVVSRGKKRLEDEARGAELDERTARISPDALATIMYTSGTTGAPKGAMLTHANFVFEVSALEGLMDLGPHDEQLLMLPMAHVFARILEMAQLRVGYVTSFTESMAGAAEDLVEVNPTFLGSVPRLFEKLFEAAHHRAKVAGGLRRKLFHWAIEVGLDVAKLRRAKKPVPMALSLSHKYADREVLSRVRSAFGSRFRFALSGGAPLSPALGEWFEACGVTILEGYGLTETSAATHVTRFAERRFGSVGKPIPGVEVKLAEDGEVLLRSPSVMRGYWKRPEATAEAIDADGFLHTGDVGRVDADGTLTITDRKKDILVTSGGKNVAPQTIETELRAMPWIHQAVVFGDRRKHLVALLTLDETEVTRWARENDREAVLSALSRDRDVMGKLRGEVDAVNRKLARHETIKRFAVLDRELSSEHGELTPTLKIRRRAVYEKHRAMIDALYDDEG